jgi:type IV secretion system protein VirB9
MRACGGSVLALLLLAGEAARAEFVPPPGATDARVRTATFSVDEVYRITGFVGYEIHIEFQSGERFVGLAAGDLEGLGYSTVDNNLFLKPKAATVGTNLTIVTSRRRYHFDYTASAKRPPSGSKDVIYSLRFAYPLDPKAGRADRVNEALEDGTQRERNLAYGYCGSPSLKPVSAYDDGIHTHLRFEGHAEWPAVFVRTEDGTESLVNFTVRGDELILHRVVRRVILRRGKLTGCVVNQAFVGSAERLDSGTTSEEVRREVARSAHD